VANYCFGFKQLGELDSKEIKIFKGNNKDMPFILEATNIGLNSDVY